MEMLDLLAAGDEAHFQFETVVVSGFARAEYVTGTLGAPRPALSVPPAEPALPSQDEGERSYRERRLVSNVYHRCNVIDRVSHLRHRHHSMP